MTSCKMQYAAVVGLVTLFAATGCVGSNGHAREIHLIKNDLRGYRNNPNDVYDDRALFFIAQAFAYAGDSQFALQVVDRISNNASKASTLRAIAESYAKLGEVMKDSTMLSEAIKTVERTSDARSKAEALSAIAESYAKLEDRERASALLVEAAKTAERMDWVFKAETLSAVAKSFVKLAESANDRTLYDKAFKLIEGLNRDEDRDAILESILASKMAVTDVGRLRSLTSHYSSESGKAIALARILMACSHPELIGKEKESEDDNGQ